MSETKRSNTRVRGFDDTEMDFQLLRQLGSAAYGGASVGETLSCVASMQEEAPKDWVRVFSQCASSLESDAKNRESKGYRRSAYEQYLKASNNYRAAEYYTNINDPNHKKYGLRSRETFLAGIKLSEYNCEAGFVEYNDLRLPYNLLSIDTQKRKTIIIVSGFDGTLEESYIQSGLAALQRGYNVILYAGPGQMDSMRFNKTHFEPDYENPVKVLLDSLFPNPLIDETRLALYGISFGGYFATRAACFEQRIRALIVNSPIISLHDYMVGFIGFDPLKLPEDEDFGVEDIPFISDEELAPSQKESLTSMLQRFGNRSFIATYQYLESFSVETTLEKLDVPCLALTGEGEGEEPLRQHRFFCDAVKGAKEYVFTQQEGADTHCQLGNLSFSNCVIYDWLDEQFA